MSTLTKAEQIVFNDVAETIHTGTVSPEASAIEATILRMRPLLAARGKLLMIAEAYVDLGTAAMGDGIPDQDFPGLKDAVADARATIAAIETGEADEANGFFMPFAYKAGGEERGTPVPNGLSTYIGSDTVDHDEEKRMPMALNLEGRCGLRVIMGNGGADNSEYPDVHFERQVGRWSLLVHPGGGDPVMNIKIHDDHRVTVERDRLIGNEPSLIVEFDADGREV